MAGTLAGVTVLTLVVRRRYPLTVLAAVLPPWALLSVLMPMLVLFWGGLVPMCVAVYSVARYGLGRTPYVGAGVGAAALLVYEIGTGMITRPAELFFPWLVLAAAWSAGYFIHRKDLAATTSEQRAREITAHSREQTLVALAEERARIARELHDIVAHSVTAIVVQAGAAAEVVKEDPEYVEKSLDGIRRTGSEALEEMRRVVTLLRDSGDPEPVGPQPGLADLGLLVERAQLVGQPATEQQQATEREAIPGADQRCRPRISFRDTCRHVGRLAGTCRRRLLRLKVLLGHTRRRGTRVLDQHVHRDT